MRKKPSAILTDGSYGEAVECWFQLSDLATKLNTKSCPPSTRSFRWPSEPRLSGDWAVASVIRNGEKKEPDCRNSTTWFRQASVHRDGTSRVCLEPVACDHSSRTSAACRYRHRRSTATVSSKGIFRDDGGALSCQSYSASTEPSDWQMSGSTDE